MALKRREGDTDFVKIFAAECNDGLGYRVDANDANGIGLQAGGKRRYGRADQQDGFRIVCHLR